MPVNTTALTTLTNLKEALEIGASSTASDNYLERIINRASSWIETKVNRKLKARRYNGGTSNHGTTVVPDEDYIYFSGYHESKGGDTLIDENGFGIFYLPQWPVQANSVLTFVLATLDDREDQTWDTTDLVENTDYIVDRQRGILRLLNGRFTPGMTNYRITMAAGYQVGSNQPFVPEDLELACIELCKRMYRESSNVQSESIGTWSRTFNTAAKDPFMEDTIQQYSRFSL